MQCPYFSDIQSKKLTSDVLNFQKNRSNDQLHAAVHLATQRLLYTLPIYFRILQEEDCCEFLFYCYDTIDHYIDSYREGNLSYLGYISQVVRKRSRYFVTLRRTKKMKEQVILESEQAETQYEQESYASETFEQQGIYGKPIFTKINLVPEESMPELFHLLIDNREKPGENQIIFNPSQKILKEKLKNKVNRKRFIIMLAISPHLMNQHLLIELAAILDVDVKLLDEYLSTATKILDSKKQTREIMEQTSRRHFRRLMEIQGALQTATEVAEREKLLRLQAWTERAFNTKIQKIREMEFHLSHSQISTLLKIPKGTVASSVHYVKFMLQECLDE
ncbi:hypothetical protein [uncultured Sphaerochaeta sp.]|uniref:hypothetical protein n=1 Tax=uncultured Sphaerochaeta sp. TaxID=886478 RepID=UPI002A0A4156|nr:hypothetical protein [uncultured Sphaerochaeta sp.]